MKQTDKRSGRLQKIRRLWQQRRLLFCTLSLVVVVRLGLTFLSYQKVRKLVPKLVKPCSCPAPLSNYRASRIVWAVSHVSRIVPQASCLTQAIATQVMLARHGEDSRLHIGVARCETGQFVAHAWVEWREQTIIGGTSRQYTPLTVFNAVGI